MSTQEETMKYFAELVKQEEETMTDIIFDLKSSDSPYIRELHTNLDFKKLGLGQAYGDCFNAPRLVEKIDGVFRLSIFRYYIQIEKSPLDFFKWKDIETQLITEIKSWVNNPKEARRANLPQAVYTISNNIPD